MANRAAAAGDAAARQGKGGGLSFLRWLNGNPWWDSFIFVCIVVNAIILGYDAHYGEANRYHDAIEFWNMAFLYIFTAEIILEGLAQGPRRYFTNGWNIFDVVVVALSYVAVSPAISALRTLRVVRVFRLIGAVPQMRRVVEALFAAMPGILATFAILAIVFYIGAVMATTLFHEDEGFRNLGESALSLFALSQFDGWGETVVRLQEHHSFAWAFVLGFTVIAAFAVLNLFIGVIVEAVQQAPHEVLQKELSDVEEDIEEVQEAQEDAAVVQQRILDELKALRADVAALREKTD